MIWGIVLVILGILALSFSLFTSIATVIFLGFILILSGVVILLDAFQFWRQVGGFSFQFLIGLLYLIAGLMLVIKPLAASISLTFLFAIFFIVLGAFRVIYAFTHRTPRWGWYLFSGITSIILGLLVLAGWPATGLVFIGIIVGIDLLIAGWSYIMLSLYSRRTLG